MLRRILFIVLLLVASSAHAGKFQRVVFIDCYRYLLELLGRGEITSSDTVGIMSYFAQLDSMGVTQSFTRADAKACSNTNGIRIVGQEGMRYFNTVYYGNQRLNDLVHGGSVISGQVEANASNQGQGAWWQRTGGVLTDDNTTVTWRSGTDASGQILLSKGAKFGSKYLRNLKAVLRMKVWDTGTTDTIVKVVFSHWSDSCAVRTTCTDKIYVDKDTMYFTGTSFSDVGPNAWKTFSTNPTDSMLFQLAYRSISIEVKWNGTDSVAIDSISVFDALGDVLTQISDLTMDTVIQAYYASIDTSHHGRFYPSDEPYPPMFYGFNRFDDAGARNGPGHRSQTSINFNHGLFIEVVNPSEMIPNFYPITRSHDSLTTPASGLSIQLAYNALCDKLKLYSDSIVGKGPEFWYYMQSGAERFPGTDSSLWKRKPTPTELKTELSLAIMYGASGVGYYTYTPLWMQYTFPYDTSLTSPTYSMDTAASKEIGLLSQYALSPDNAGSTPPNVSGIVDWNPSSRRFEPTDRWYAARDHHKFVDSIWKILDTLTWRGANTWKNVKTITGSNIDSVYSAQFPYDSAYVQVARWTSGDSKEYWAVLNRRTHSSDAQTAKIRYNSQNGCVRFYDIYRDSTYYAYDSSGTIVFSTPLAPGEMRVFRVQEFTTFSGTWEGTWPQYSTINITGDINVDAGTSLTISTNGVSIPANTDGANLIHANKIDFQVKGNLRLVGSAGNRITLQATGDSSWYGITTATNGTDSGWVYIDNAIIKNAYIGVYDDMWQVDTIKNTRFESCFSTGVRTKNPVHLRSDSFLVNGVYGIDLVGGWDTAFVTKCYFENVKTGINSVSWGVIVLDSSKFVRTTYLTSSTGVYLQYPNITKIKNTSFNNYETGIYSGTRSVLTVTNCKFHADSTQPASYGIEPFMFYGLKHEGAQTTSKVRHSCFWNINDVSAFAGSAGLDLGTSSDTGWNEFYADSVFVQPDKWDANPDFVIDKNYAGGTLYAKRNHFSAGCDFDGTTIDTSVITHAEPTCIPTGPGSKLADPTYVKTPQLAASFEIAQNYPNPFNPTTTISFTLPHITTVRIEVFNLLGQKVRTLLDDTRAAGSYQIEWDGTNSEGQSVSTGLYLYRIEAGEYVTTKKMMLVK